MDALSAETQTEPEPNSPSSGCCDISFALSTPPGMSYFANRQAESELLQRRLNRSVVGTGTPDRRLLPSSGVGELFLSNVHHSISAADVKKFIEDKATVIQVRQISHPNAMAKSFLLTVPAAELNKLMWSSFWPPAVRCREFVRPRCGRLASAPCYSYH
jgi:hypothetical protein